MKLANLLMEHLFRMSYNSTIELYSFDFVFMIVVSTDYKKNFNKYFLGVFVPVTMEGNIMVDGVLAFCYASADHD